MHGVVWRAEKNAKINSKQTALDTESGSRIEGAGAAREDEAFFLVLKDILAYRFRFGTVPSTRQVYRETKTNRNTSLFFFYFHTQSTRICPFRTPLEGIKKNAI